jgi:branched-chain amino acid transport system permease protein
MPSGVAMIVTLILNSIALAALLIMLASGLALIYGLRDVMNFGHGAIYMLGAYLGYSVSDAMNFWAALVVVPLLLAGLGIAFEFLVLRPLRRRSHIEIALVTFGLGLILGQIIIWIYGGVAKNVTAPSLLSGAVGILGVTFPVYRLFLIGAGLGSCVLLAAWINFTISGLYVRAVSQDPHVARMMGVNASRLGILVSGLSMAFAGLAGVLAGPYLAVDPGMDIAMMVNCLMIVVIGGTGSISGAILAALLYGFVQVIGTVLLPNVAILIPYLLLVAVLLWRPQGLGGSRVSP